MIDEKVGLEETVLRAWDASKAQWRSPDGRFPAYAFAVFREGFVRALESAKPKEAEGWQDIASAPKDIPIDLWTEPYGRVADARWSDKKSGWVDWGSDDFGSVAFRRVEGRVTHWRPLPEPPSAMLSAAGERA